MTTESGTSEPRNAASARPASAPADLRRPLLVVDAANVVGSVPDGWWRDRQGAATRLRDAIAPLPAQGLADADPWLPTPLDVVLVVEGAARRVGSIPEVRVVAAAGSGDDAIVALVGEEAKRRPHVAVVTSDKELRARVTALGARVLGPRSLPYPDDEPIGRAHPGR